MSILMDIPGIDRAFHCKVCFIHNNNLSDEVYSRANCKMLFYAVDSMVVVYDEVLFCIKKDAS